MLRIYMSHQVEQLADRLVSELGQPGGSPLKARQVIVPNAAMRQFLTLRLADAGGICANVDFAYLARWMWQRIAEVLPVPAESPYARDGLTWRIFHVFSDARFVRAHPRLQGWLSAQDEAGRYELASRVARLFEQYLIYRPDWLVGWYAKDSVQPLSPVTGVFWPEEDEAWQAALWRRIEAELGSKGVHPAVSFFAHLESDLLAASVLPDTLYVFCLPAIAPQYFDMLGKVGRRTNVELYVFNPSKAFWLDVVPEKQRARHAATGRESYHETGNMLLAGWGRQCQSQLSLLMEIADDWTFLPARVDSGKTGTLLSRIQQAVHELHELELDALLPDRSLEIHVCHSLMREVEVLHEQLLALFASENPPSPQEVLVVTPDIDLLAPMVDAVFGSTSIPAIPYRIVGRATARVNPVARALESVLALATSRVTATEVQDLLMQPLIADRFRLTAVMEQVHDWLLEAGICWGMDGGYREEMDLPVDDSRSFFDGFYRLFLAYALPAASQHPFGERLAVGNPEGAAAVALGSLWHFVEQLGRLRQKLAVPCSPAAWQRLLLEVLDSFIEGCSDTLEDELAVREAIAQLVEKMTVAGGEKAVGAAVLRRALSAALAASTPGSVPTGQVTIGTMAGLRHLPYRFVFAVGLNDGVFPANPRQLEFDLMRSAPRLGDLQRREDDRNIFLDLLLCARERFIITYTGRSVRDNSERPPSVVVAELMDVLSRALLSRHPAMRPDEAAKKVADALLVLHPLQPFSLRYFEAHADERIRSTAAVYCEAQLKRLAQSGAAPELPQHTSEGFPSGGVSSAPVFFAGHLPEADDGWRDTSLTELSRFFQNPSRYLLQSRMGLMIPARDTLLPSVEPLLADGLGPYHLAERLLPLLLADEAPARIRAAARAGLEFPAGAMGELQLDAVLAEMHAFASRFKHVLAGAEPVSHHAALSFRLDNEGEAENWRLTGLLPELRAGGLLLTRFARSTSGGSVRFRLDAWIKHLFLNASPLPGINPVTSCFFADRTLVYDPIDCEEATACLKDLLLLYRQGLAAPLRFFPLSAAAYMEANEKMADAHASWQPRFGGFPGEGDDVFVQLATRGLPDPLDADFIDCARRVMGPILKRQRWEDD